MRAHARESAQAELTGPAAMPHAICRAGGDVCDWGGGRPFNEPPPLAVGTGGLGDEGRGWRKRLALKTPILTDSASNWK